MVYAERLKEFIRYSCKFKNRFSQAVIAVSNNNTALIIDSANEVSDRPGRPSKKKHRT